jgi:hypothetical protein
MHELFRQLELSFFFFSPPTLFLPFKQICHKTGLKETRTRQEKQVFFVVFGIVSALTLLLANICKASTCLTERRKSKREQRKLWQLAGGIWVGLEPMPITVKQAFLSCT